MLPLTGSGGGSTGPFTADRSLPPPSIAVLLGALTTVATTLCFATLHDVWITFGAVFCIWVVAPCGMCCAYPGLRGMIVARGRHKLRHACFQATLALPLAVLTIAFALLAIHFGARALGFERSAVRMELAEFGVSNRTVGSDVGTMAWLSALNPVMEEGFWRLFLFEQLRATDGSRWWAPASVVSCLYAAYHLPVVWSFLPPMLVALAAPFLFSLGLTLQLMVERHGLVLAAMVHSAFDIVACLILSDILWPWGLTPTQRRLLRLLRAQT
jgi:hypothetical protein